MFSLRLLTSKLRPLVIASMILVLGVTSVSCSSEALLNDSQSQQPQIQQPQAQPPEQSGESQVNQTRISDGTYPVQQVTYNDATGGYSAMLLNTKAGEPAVFETANLPMARLTEEEISSGQGNYLKVEQGQPSLHLKEDFRIEYVHNVTEEVTNPQTGTQETVVVRRETGFWAPFAGALAGQALGSLLFTPHYYFPPVYRPGIVMVGYGGYGRTYNQAVNRYQTRYRSAPPEVRNRQTLRTAGRLRNPGIGQTNRQSRPSGDRATGSGYGNSNLRRDRYTPSRRYERPSGGFGSFGRSRSFRGGRRR